MGTWQAKSCGNCCSRYGYGIFDSLDSSNVYGLQGHNGPADISVNARFMCTY